MGILLLLAVLGAVIWQSAPAAAQDSDATSLTAPDVDLKPEGGDDGVMLSWSPGSNPDTTTYDVKRREGTEGDWVKLATVPSSSVRDSGDSLTYVDGTAASGTRYDYKVVANNKTQTATSLPVCFDLISGYRLATDSVTNSAVHINLTHDDLGALASNDSQELTVSRGKVDESPRVIAILKMKSGSGGIISYEELFLNEDDVLQRIDHGSTLPDSSPFSYRDNGFAYEDDNVESGETYEYKAWAWRSTAAAPCHLLRVSAPATITALTPPTLTGQAIDGGYTTGVIVLNWDRPEGNVYPDGFSYEIERDAAKFAGVDVVARLSPAPGEDVLTYTDASVLSWRGYVYTLRVKDALGNVLTETSTGLEPIDVDREAQQELSLKAIHVMNGPGGQDDRIMLSWKKSNADSQLSDADRVKVRRLVSQESSLEATHLRSFIYDEPAGDPVVVSGSYTDADLSTGEWHIYQVAIYDDEDEIIGISEELKFWISDPSTASTCEEMRPVGTAGSIYDGLRVARTYYLNDAEDAKREGTDTNSACFTFSVSDDGTFDLQGRGVFVDYQEKGIDWRTWDVAMEIFDASDDQSVSGPHRMSFWDWFGDNCVVEGAESPWHRGIDLDEGDYYIQVSTAQEHTAFFMMMVKESVSTD